MGWVGRRERVEEEIFDIEIGKMSKSNMIKYCRDEWIVISADVMMRLREKEERINKVEI